MSFQDFAGSVDREFIEDWLAKTGETLQEVPDTEDGRAIGSLMCQLAVMALLQEREQIPSDQEKALDFAMEFVTRLWPLFPLGVRSDFGQKGWQQLEYLSWREPNSVSHNLFVTEARRNFREALFDVFSEFPLLTAEDKDHILSVTPSIRSLGEYLTSAEQELARRFGFSLLDDFQWVQFNHYMGDYPDARTEPQTMYELFAGSEAPVFVELRHLSPDYYAVISAHRTAFAQPPRSSHAEFIHRHANNGLAALLQQFENTAPIVNMTQEELRECFMKLTFMGSYEAAYQLLMSDDFLNRASGRDSLDRDRSGFNFWYDLTLAYASKTATTHLLALADFYETTFPFFSATEIARVLVGNPLCIFLELIRLGSRNSGTIIPDNQAEP